MDEQLQRGMAAFQAGRLHEAAGLFAAVLQADPDDIAARSFLGQALTRLGKLLEGHAHLRDAARDLLDHARDGAEIGHALDVVQLLQQSGDFPGALELAREATAIAPDNPRTHQQRAVSASMTNHREEAMLACGRALALAPQDPMLAVLMASLELDAGATEAGLSRLQTALQAGLPERAAFRAHKEIARALDKLGRHGEVFAHLHASAAIGPKLPEYARQPAAELAQTIRANRSAFDAALLRRWAGHAFDDDPGAPVFIIGFYRSGTTLTQAVLDAHRQVFVADEAPLVWQLQREVHRLDPAPGDTAAKLRRLGAGGIAGLRRHYWQQVHDRYGREALAGRTFIDKFTMNTVDIGLVGTVFPDARVLFVQRDPRDVCLSAYLQLMPPTAATARLLTWRGTAQFYDDVLAWWMHVKPMLPLRVHEFRYENAVTAFEDTFRSVLDFLGLPWDPAIADFHTRAAGKVISSPSRQQVAQPLYVSSVARWRHHAGEFAAVDDLLQPWAQRLGYDAA